MKENRGAAEPHSLEGVDAAICPRAADEYDKSVSQELLPDGEREHADHARAASGRELSAWIKFKVFSPLKNGAPTNAVADSR